MLTIKCPRGHCYCLSSLPAAIAYCHHLLSQTSWGLRWGYRVLVALKEGDGWKYKVDFCEGVELEGVLGDGFVISTDWSMEVALQSGRSGRVLVRRLQLVGIGCVLMVDLECIGKVMLQSAISEWIG